MSSQAIAIIITAATASLLEIIDSSIVNVAIPTMMGNIGATLDEISWVTTGYMIANSIVLPIAAWLGTRLGRRSYFTAAILFFTLASFACGMAPNLTLLILFRILQGLAGGALLPTSQTLIQEQFPREKAGMAMAIFGMSVMVGPALGPTIGGYLTDNHGWRSIFNLNVPIGLFAAALSWIYVYDVEASEHSQAAKNSRVDWLGLFFLCLGVGSFQYVLERGEAEQWFESLSIRICAFLAFFGSAFFIFWELRIRDPIMNLKLFKNNVVRSGTALMLMLGVMVYALTFVIPIFISRVIPNMDATQTGLLFMPGSIATAVCMLPVGNLLRVVNPKLLVLMGIGLGECAVFLMSLLTSQSSADAVLLPLIVRGVAMAFLFVPINQMVLGSFRGPELGQVAGMQNFFRQIGGSIGISSLDTLITRFGAQHYNDLMTHVNALNPAGYLSFIQNKGSSFSRMTSQLGLWGQWDLAAKSLHGRVLLQVFVLSFEELCWVIMILIALGVIPLYFIKPETKTTGPILGGH